MGMTKMLSSSSSSMNMGSIMGDCVAAKKKSNFSNRFKCYRLTGCCLSCCGSGCSSGCGSCSGCRRCCGSGGGGNGGVRSPQPEGIRPISAQ